MIEKIKKYLNLNLKINKKTLEITYLELLFILLILSSSFDALTTDLVLSNGGKELNLFIKGLYDKGLFTFYYSKIVAFPVIFLFVSKILSDLHFKIFRDDLKADNFLIYSALIFIGFYSIAGIVNLINYLILIIK